MTKGWEALHEGIEQHLDRQPTQRPKNENPTDYTPADILSYYTPPDDYQLQQRETYE
jgi:hypothetical protein